MSNPEFIKAAVLTQVGCPLEIIEGIKVPELEIGQVLVKMHYAGICHSQLMEVRGKRGEDRWLPHMLGHEGTGEVIKVGGSVTKVKVGEQVVLGWIKGEGIEAASPNFITTDGLVINAGGVTTFSDYTVVSENRLVPLPEGTPYDLGVLYGCALPTGAGIVLNEISPDSQTQMAVFGLGGIGLSALMAASLYEPEMLIAIDIEDSKLELAKQLGATHIINSAEVEPIKEVMKLTNGKGLDYVVEAAGLSDTITQAFDMVRRGGGRCIFASHPASGDKVCIDPFELICGKSLEGSWGGASKPDRDIPILGQYYRDGKLGLEHMIKDTYSLDTINQAMDDLDNRKIVRALLKLS